MKIRIGFISNSSSSSFVLRKRNMSIEQIEQIRKFLKKQSGHYETYFTEFKEEFIGSIEEHNIHSDEAATAADMLRGYLEAFEIDSNDYEFSYE